MKNHKLLLSSATLCAVSLLAYAGNTCPTPKPATMVKRTTFGCIAEPNNNSNPHPPNTMWVYDCDPDKFFQGGCKEPNDKAYKCSEVPMTTPVVGSYYTPTWNVSEGSQPKSECQCVDNGAPYQPSPQKKGLAGELCPAAEETVPVGG